MSAARSSQAMSFFLGLSLSLACPVFSQNADSQSVPANSQQSAYRSSLAEESVRKQADKIQAEIVQLVTDLKLNGLETADMTALSNASNHLQTLSQQDIQKVINALQSASMNGQAKDQQQSLVKAFKGQQDILLSLKSLSVDLAAQEAQKEIPSKIENLIARQSANIRQTSALSVGVQTPDQLDAQKKSVHEVVTSEQAAIAGEIDLLFKVLAVTPETPTTPDGKADTSKAVLEAMTGGSLKDIAASAAQLTSEGPFPSALNQQKAVQDKLTSALRESLTNLDLVSRLQMIKAQLDQVVNDQQDLAAVAQEGKLDGSTLAERQAKINDRTTVTQALLKPVNSTASLQVDQAQQAMDASSSALLKAIHTADTAPQQKAVVDNLHKAEDMLDQQIASAQKQEATSPLDKFAQLQQLLGEINQAQQNPQTSAGDLHKLQQDALSPSPEAANKIADAADKLQQPQPDAAGANQLVSQAKDVVQQQMNALKQAAQEYQALSQASQELSQAQQQTAAANQSIQNTANQTLTEAAHDLSQAEANVDQVAQQLSQQAATAQGSQPGGQPSGAGQPATAQGSQPGGQPSDAGQPATAQGSQPGGQPSDAGQPATAQGSQQGGQPSGAGQPATAQGSQPGGMPSGAGQALQQASEALKNATMQAVQAQRAGAQTQAQKAMAAMQQAQAGLAQAMAQMQQEGQGQGQGGQEQSQSQAQGQAQGSGPGEAPEHGGQVLKGSGANGIAQVMGGLKSKDRDAIAQYQAEKSPPEYAPLVQQYLKNLADSSQGH